MVAKVSTITEKEREREEVIKLYNQIDFINDDVFTFYESKYKILLNYPILLDFPILLDDWILSDYSMLSYNQMLWNYWISSDYKMLWDYQMLSDYRMLSGYGFYRINSYITGFPRS